MPGPVFEFYEADGTTPLDAAVAFSLVAGTTPTPVEFWVYNDKAGTYGDSQASDYQRFRMVIDEGGGVFDSSDHPMVAEAWGRVEEIALDDANIGGAETMAADTSGPMPVGWQEQPLVQNLPVRGGRKFSFTWSTPVYASATGVRALLQIFQIAEPTASGAVLSESVRTMLAFGEDITETGEFGFVHAPFACQISQVDIFARALGDGTAGDHEVDVLVGGVSIYALAADRPRIAFDGASLRVENTDHVVAAIADGAVVSAELTELPTGGTLGPESVGVNVHFVPTG